MHDKVKNIRTALNIETIISFVENYPLTTFNNACVCNNNQT